VGDEPFMMAAKLKVPVAVCGNRARAARLVEDKIDVIIMDDGLQNYTLVKDVEICVFDGGKGLGNGFVFPAGPLRQPVSRCLSGVDAAVVMGGRNPGLEKRISGYVPAVFRAAIVPSADLGKYRGRRVIAFAGIGNPAKFFGMLRAHGVFPAKELAFPDHHDYAPGDIDALLRAARRGHAVLMTTEKDHVKIPPARRKDFVPVGIRVEIEGEDRFFRKAGCE
jgi:tetraacyldisaccharide 4'-kinase